MHQHDGHQMTMTQLLVYSRSIIDADASVGERNMLLIKTDLVQQRKELSN